MTHLSSITASVGALPQRAQALFALGCAERMAPVFRRWARPASVKVFNDILDTAWQSVTSENCITNAKRSLDLIDQLPEAMVDDSVGTESEYYAMVSLSVLAYAFQSLIGNELSVAIESACSAALDLCGNCDFVIGKKGIRKIFYGQDPFPTDELESVEMTAQNATAHVLRNATNVDESLCKNIRQMAKEASVQLTHALPKMFQPL